MVLSSILEALPDGFLNLLLLARQAVMSCLISAASKPLPAPPGDSSRRHRLISLCGSCMREGGWRPASSFRRLQGAIRRRAGRRGAAPAALRPAHAAVWAPRHMLKRAQAAVAFCFPVQAAHARAPRRAQHGMHGRQAAQAPGPAAPAPAHPGRCAMLCALPGPVGRLGACRRCMCSQA